MRALFVLQHKGNPELKHKEKTLNFKQQLQAPELMLTPYNITELLQIMYLAILIQL